MEVIEKPAATGIAEYNATAAALAELRTRLAGVAYDVSTGKGMDIAKRDRAEVRGLRVALEAKRVELKAPALERSRLIDAEAKAITAELLALEKPIDEQIKREEERKEAAKIERERLEREAALVIQGKIDTMRNTVLHAVGATPGDVSILIASLFGVQVNLDTFGERAGEAAQVKAQTLEKLDAMRVIACNAERAAAQLQAERDAVEKMRAEIRARADAEDAKRAEAERIAKAARAAEEAQLAEARAQVEAANKALRDAEAAAAASARKAEQDAMELIAKQQREAAYAAEMHRRAAEEAQHVADKRVRDAAPALLAALQDMLPAYRQAVNLIDPNTDDAFSVAARIAIQQATLGA